MDILVLILGILTILVWDKNGFLTLAEQGSLFRLDCNLTRWEVTFPYLTDTRGAIIPKSRLPDEDTSSKIPQHLHISLKWRRKIINVALLQAHLVGSTASQEWDENNVTFSQHLEDKCFYQGYVKNKFPSHSALGICGGLAGYIQTPDEMLFIEPAGVTNEKTGLQAHVIYTCSRQATNLDDDTMPDSSLKAITSEKSRHQKFRAKRSTRKTKYVEAFIAVDTTVTSVVGKSKVQLYIMTLMNIVNSVYQHDSLGIDIKVVVVRLMLLDKTQEKQVVSKNDPFGTVQKFCMWAMRYADPNSAQGHDVAILLTRENLGPAGYAPITGMCNPGRSCAAIKDEGFTSGFIIAHEMAHVMGLFHDGRGNTCTGAKYRTAIMARLVESKLNYYWWSKCSKKRMEEVIDYLYCLNDDPYILPNLPEVPELPGKGWSLEHQCRLEFGEEFSVCHAFYPDPCAMLWCSKRRTPNLCRTKRGPSLDGTPCGVDKSCVNSRCIYIGNLSPRDGNWADWSPWTKCTSDCGTGLRYRTRDCDNPSPAYGGKECDGEKSITDVCKSEKCTNYVDDRALQCSVWNDMNIRPGEHNWQPYYTDRPKEYCKSTCISEQSREILTIDIDVEDGTPCTYSDTDDICVHGKCMIVGCDSIVNSTKSNDRCGVCGGDGSQCKSVSGSFNKTPTAGEEYEQVIFVPNGATHVEVSKNKRSPHFLALKDPEYQIFYLNGEKKKVRSRTFIANGAIFEYVNGPTQEILTTKGPVKRNLEVMMYPDKYLKPSSITYQYTIDKNDHTLEKIKYKWKFKEWSECSVTCGTGTQKILYACHDKFTDKRINDEMCSYLDEPRADVAMCYRPDCSQLVFNWVMLDEWSECSATCGESGQQTELYACEQHLEDGTYEVVDKSQCSKIPAPNESRPCNIQQCSEQWSVGEWGKCSVTCGTGTQTRGVYCGAKNSNSAGCFDDPPPDTQECVQTECPMDWSIGQWSECSVTCGDGEETRNVYCGEKDDPSDDLLCLEQDAPDSVRDCYRHECPREWSVGEWSLCSKTCGEGVETRAVYCGEEGDFDDHLCIGNDKPGDVSDCFLAECPLEWSTEDWTDCSQSCGEGLRYRNVFCGVEEEDYDDYRCVEEFKPSDTKPCFLGDCPLEWTVGEWQECSVTCGGGVETRAVYCGVENEDFDDHLCVDNYRPGSVRGCFLAECPLEWSTGDWTDCSQSCEEGVSYRDVFCGVEEEDYDDYLCNEELKPDDIKKCFLGECPMEWTVGEWQECSKTCGTGIEKRVVYCGNEEDETDDHLCSNNPPSSTKFCNKGKCMPPRRPRCEKDKYSFCRTANAKKCIFGGFKKMCCKSCSRLTGAAYSRIAALRRFAKARRQSKRRRRFRSRRTRRNRRRS